MGVLRFAIFAILLLLAGCAAGPREVTNEPFPNEQMTEASYLLDTGDVLRVTIYGDQQLSTNYGIDDAGYISMPLVGRVYARGHTVSQTSATITSRLASGYMRNPNVAVEVAQYRPFFIQGEVTNSGQFAFVFGMTVRAAISAAGGFTDVASKNGATIYRKSKFDVSELRAGLNDLIQPGDTIVVHERWF